MNEEHSQSALQFVELLAPQGLDLLRNVLAIDLRPLPFAQQTGLLQRPRIKIVVVLRARRLVGGRGRAENLSRGATGHLLFLHSLANIAQNEPAVTHSITEQIPRELSSRRPAASPGGSTTACRDHPGCMRRRTVRSDPEKAGVGRLDLVALRFDRDRIVL